MKIAIIGCGEFAKEFVPLFKNHPTVKKVYVCDLIKEKAATENCIIVGRCGNYVLEDAENAVHVFIYADEDAKVTRTMERHQISRDEAEKRIKKMDKQRRAYYQYYTEWKWARTEGFDIMLNSSALGVDATVAAIKAIVEAKMK